MEIKTSDSYQKEILARYKREKGGDMRGYLAEPTRRQIREACIALLGKRNLKHDEHILNRFFQFEEGKNRILQIQHFKADKFVPIVKFLKEKVQRTSPENIELISWLIDFQPRPLQEYLKPYNSIYEEEPERFETEIIDEPKDEVEKKKEEDEKRRLKEVKRKEEEERKKKEEEERKLEEIKIKKKKKRKLIITISIAFGAILITTLIIQNKIFPVINDLPSNNEIIDNPINPNDEAVDNPINANIDAQLVNKCMTWADSLYIAVSCDKGPFSKYGTHVKPLDPMELKNMCKVEVDAAYQFFTATGKPRIWYYKKSSREIEYFTAPGYHPVNDETLRKITPYIIDTYVPIHSKKENSFIKQ